MTTTELPPKRLQGEKFSEFQARQRAWSEARRQEKPAAKKRRARADRVADHVDGYDRDDLGLSPDY